MKKLPDIQILRALACIAVLFSHIQFLHELRPTIFLGCERQGVYLFFSISGFIILKTLDELGLLKEFGSNLYAQVALLRVYFIRRFFRIFPVALLNLGFIFTVSYLLRNISEPMVKSSDFLQFLFSFLTLGVDVHRWNVRVFNEPGFIDYGYWSLSGEEKSYILLSILCILIKKPKNMVRFFLGWIVFSYFFHVCLSFYIKSFSGVLELYYHSPLITISQFFMGSITYLLYKQVKPTFVNAKNYFIIFSLLCITTFSSFQVFKDSVQSYLVSLFFSPIIVYFSATQTGLYPRFLLRNFLIKVGDRSYILYLVHAPIYFVIEALTKSNYFAFAKNYSRLLEVSLFFIALWSITEIIHKKFERPLIRYGRQKSNKILEEQLNNAHLNPASPERRKNEESRKEPEVFIT